MDISKRPNVKPCPLCGKTPTAILYDAIRHGEEKSVFRLLCVEHQDECSPELRTAPANRLDDAVWGWNTRVSRVTNKYNIKRVFQEIQHEEFVSFLGGDSDG